MNVNAAVDVARQFGLAIDNPRVLHVGDNVAYVENGLGIKNGVQGEAVSVCSGVRAPWTVLRTIS